MKCPLTLVLGGEQDIPILRRGHPESSIPRFTEWKEQEETRRERGQGAVRRGEWDRGKGGGGTQEREREKEAEERTRDRR